MNSVKNEMHDNDEFNSEIHQIRHDLKGLIRRQDLILEFIIKKIENGETNIEKPKADMNSSIAQTTELWNKLLAIVESKKG